MTSKNVLKRVAAATIAALALCGLSACISPITGLSEQTLNDILKSPLTGYEADGPIVGGGCGFDNCDYNKGVSLSKVSAASVAKECTRMITWAASIGANTWHAGMDNIRFPLKGYESQAIIACTMSQMSERAPLDDPDAVITSDYLGETMTGDFGLRGSYLGNDLKSPFDIDFDSSRVARASKSEPITRRWAMTVTTTYHDTQFKSPTTLTWDSSYARIGDESRQLHEILDAVGHYRVTHPEADPYSASAIKAALAKLPKTTKYSLAKFPNGSVHYVFVTSAEVWNWKIGGLCMSLKAFDTKLMGAPDPGTGYTHFSNDSFAQFNEFGAWVQEKCPNR